MGDRHREPVILNIYDLCCCNPLASVLGLGLYHSGVEVYRTEFGSGGHVYDASSIFQIVPRDYELLAKRINYKMSIVMGHTSLTQYEVYQALEKLGNDFKGTRFHCLTKNCNHFSSALTKLLCGKEVPAWVNRAAYFATYVPFLRSIPTKEQLWERQGQTPPLIFDPDPLRCPPATPACNVSATPEENNNTEAEGEKPKKIVVTFLFAKKFKKLKTQSPFNCLVLDKPIGLRIFINKPSTEQ